jgi:hypothetical protein
MQVDENTKDEALLDAEQWERFDEQSLYGACLNLINASLVGEASANTNENGKIVIQSPTIDGKEWKAARREVLLKSKMLRTSRKNRKRVQERLLSGLPPYESGEKVADQYGSSKPIWHRGEDYK